MLDLRILQITESVVRSVKYCNIICASGKGRQFDSKTVSLCGKFGAQLHEISIASGDRAPVIYKISYETSTERSKVDGEKQLIQPHITARVFRAGRFARARCITIT